MLFSPPGTTLSVHGSSVDKRSLFTQYSDTVYPDAQTYYDMSYSPSFYSHTAGSFTAAEISDCGRFVWECAYERKVTGEAAMGQLALQMKETFENMRALLGKR